MEENQNPAMPTLDAMLFDPDVTETGDQPEQQEEISSAPAIDSAGESEKVEAIEEPTEEVEEPIEEAKPVVRYDHNGFEIGVRVQNAMTRVTKSLDKDWLGELRDMRMEQHQHDDGPDTLVITYVYEVHPNDRPTVFGMPKR